MQRMSFHEWHERHDTLAICCEQGNTNMKPIPGDVAGVIYRGSARSEPVREGVVYPGPFRGVFVKSGVRPIDFTFGELRDKKGLELTLAVACRLRLGSSAHDLQAVEEYFLKDDYVLMVEDFIDSVKEVLWEAAKAFATAHTARELIFEELAEPMTGHLADYKPFNVIRFRMGLMPGRGGASPRKAQAGRHRGRKGDRDGRDRGERRSIETPQGIEIRPERYG
jgi:hypothetical protein